MSQVDLINYIPLIFWFIIFFVVLYCLIFMYILPLIYSALKVRVCFLKSLIKEIKEIFLLNLNLIRLNFLNNKFKGIGCINNLIKFIKIKMYFLLKI